MSKAGRGKAGKLQQAPMCTEGEVADQHCEARLCVGGKHMMYDYSTEKGVPHSNIGKPVVAATQALDTSNFYYIQLLIVATTQGPVQAWGTCFCMVGEGMAGKELCYCAATEALSCWMLIAP